MQQLVLIQVSGAFPGTGVHRAQEGTGKLRGGATHVSYLVLTCDFALFYSSAQQIWFLLSDGSEEEPQSPDSAPVTKSHLLIFY